MWYTIDILLIYYWYTIDILLIYYWYTIDILPGSPSLGTRWLHSKGHGQKCRVANFSKLFGSIHSYPYWKNFLVTTSRVWPSCCAIRFSSWLWQWLWAKCNFEARKSLGIHCFARGTQGFYPIPIRLLSNLKFKTYGIFTCSTQIISFNLVRLQVLAI